MSALLFSTVRNKRSTSKRMLMLIEFEHVINRTHYRLLWCYRRLRGRSTEQCFEGRLYMHSSYALSDLYTFNDLTKTVARSPAKLRNILITDHDIDAGTMEKCLTIQEGDVRDQRAVKRTLVSPVDGDRVVDFVISGIGAYPTFQWSIRQPLPLTDPTICADGIATIYAALTALSASSINSTSTGDKPLLVVVSTAGCGRGRGVPLPVYPQYHYLLGSPLADKQLMEQLVIGDRGQHVRDFVIMRPLILTNGEARGGEGLKLGWEWGREPDDTYPKELGPTIGYYVSRKDVGNWIFDKVVLQGGFEGKCIYLTY